MGNSTDEMTSHENVTKYLDAKEMRTFLLQIENQLLCLCA